MSKRRSNTICAVDGRRHYGDDLVVKFLSRACFNTSIVWYHQTKPFDGRSTACLTVAKEKAVTEVCELGGKLRPTSVVGSASTDATQSVSSKFRCEPLPPYYIYIAGSDLQFVAVFAAKCLQLVSFLVFSVVGMLLGMLVVMLAGYLQCHVA